MKKNHTDQSVNNKQDGQKKQGNESTPDTDPKVNPTPDIQPKINPIINSDQKKPALDNEPTPRSIQGEHKPMEKEPENKSNAYQGDPNRLNENRHLRQNSNPSTSKNPINSNEVYGQEKGIEGDAEDY